MERGRSRARQVVAELPTYPNAVVYSGRSLSLHAPGVRETRCHDPNAVMTVADLSQTTRRIGQGLAC
jgi:hypothetical protein